MLYEVITNGGSITFASMVPLILISYRHGFKWGIFTAFTHSLIQMIVDFHTPPVQKLSAFVLVILLDYILAFTVLGSASLFGKPFKNKSTSIAVGAFSVTTLRFLCSYVSGIVVWGCYAPEGTPVWIYSLTYNGSYMIPEIIISTIVSVILIQFPQISKKSY